MVTDTDYISSQSNYHTITTTTKMFQTFQILPTLHFLTILSRSQFMSDFDICFINKNSKKCLRYHMGKGGNHMGKGGNQNPQMEEKQTAQWTKEKGQKDNDLKKHYT